MTPAQEPADISGQPLPELRWHKVFEHVTALDGALHRSLAVREDKEIEGISAVTARWQEMEAQYRDAAALAAYANRLRSILAREGGADSIRRRVERFLPSTMKKAATSRSL